MAAILLAVPPFFRAAGRTEEFTTMLMHYFLVSLPLFPIQAVLFPLEYLLIAQKMTWPVMGMATTGLATHVACNQLLVATWQWGLTGSALSLCTAYAAMVVFLVTFNCVAGLGTRTWGSKVYWPTWRQVQEYVGLAYSSIVMRAIEYYS